MLHDVFDRDLILTCDMVKIGSQLIDTMKNKANFYVYAMQPSYLNHSPELIQDSVNVSELYLQLDTDPNLIYLANDWQSDRRGAVILHTNLWELVDESLPNDMLVMVNRHHTEQLKQGIIKMLAMVGVHDAQGLLAYEQATLAYCQSKFYQFNSIKADIDTGFDVIDSEEDYNVMLEDCNEPSRNRGLYFKWTDACEFIIDVKPFGDGQLKMQFIVRFKFDVSDFWADGYFDIVLDAKQVSMLFC
jgi:hypothetical protein